MALILEFQRHLQLCNIIGKLKNIAVTDKGDIVSKETGEKLNQVKYPFDKWDRECFEDKGYSLFFPMKASPDTAISDEGVLEHKLDGVSTRCLIHRKGLRFFGPNIVKNTEWVGEYTDKVIHLRDLELPQFRGTILDGEFVHPCGVMPDRKSAGILNPNTKYETSWNKQLEEGWLLYVAYDVLKYRGVDVRNLPYRKRLELLDNVMHDKGTGLPHHESFLPIYVVPKKGCSIEGVWYNQDSFHQYILDNNMEGTIWCDLNGKYEDDKRSKFKVKFKLEKTYDVVIMGFKPPTKEVDFDKAKTNPRDWKYWIDKRGVNIPLESTKNRHTAVTKFYYQGWIGSIDFGLYDNKGKLIYVGNCSGMDEEVRKALSNRSDKILKRFRGNKKAIGSTIEIKGQRYEGEITIRWPQFVRFRPDKDAKRCTIKEHIQQ